MAKKDKKVEEVVKEAKEEGVDVEVVSEPVVESAPKVKACGHGNTKFCKFCGPIEQMGILTTESKRYPVSGARVLVDYK